MRLRHIEVFFAIWRTGSVTSAARELAISQSSVSKTLKHAEQNLGYPLFHRMRGRLILSDEGEVLLRDTVRIHERLDHLRQNARGLRAGSARAIRVACMPSLGQWVIPQAVVAFHRRFPEVPLEIATRYEEELREGVRAQEFNLGFCFGAPRATRPAPGSSEDLEPEESTDIPGLISTLIDEARLVYISPGRSGWSAPIGLDEIDQGSMIGLSGRHSLGRALHDAMADQGIVATPRVQVQTHAIAHGMIASGMGGCIVDEYTAITQPIQIRIQPLVPPIHFGLHLLQREEKPLSRHEEAFVACLRDVVTRARRF